jgi:hypothetical protein
MIVKNVTDNDMESALHACNVQLGTDNVIFNRYEHVGKRIRFTLTVKDSKGKGARRGFQVNKDGSHRRLAKACWHAHGEFFEALLDFVPEAVIQAGTKTIDKNGGNWQDWNIGSQFEPYFYSEACDC